MTMSSDEERDVWTRLREAYNAPTKTPREEMWEVVAARIGSAAGDASTEVGGRAAYTGRGADVHDLEEARSRLRGGPPMAGPAFNRVAGWAVAAAAVLVLGIGIGRMTAPETVATGPDSDPGVVGAEAGAGIGLAAREHLGRTESLLTLVRADARDGSVDPAVAGWAEDLLAQTRLLLDRPGGVEPGVRDLLMDLELVLVQVVGAARTGSWGEARARTEVELTLRSLDEGEVLPRIQAVLPNTMSGA